MSKEGPEGVKWELGLAGFTLGKWSSSHTGTGIWSLGMGKNVKNQKWEWDLRIVKWDLKKKKIEEMGLVTPLQDPLKRPPARI